MSLVHSRVNCSIIDGQLQVLRDGTQWMVPKELVERSPVLVDTLQSTVNVECDSLVAPDGYLESYLTHVIAHTYSHDSAAASRRNVSNGSLTRYFQVILHPLLHDCRGFQTQP
jgi:hypothetical protein